MTQITSVILAAGQGTRMKSKLPKMLHKICGQPMIFYALNAALAASNDTPVMVVGHGAEAVQTAVGAAARFVVQAEQLGTGHAVMQAESLLSAQTGLVLVTYGDMPLLRAETVQKLVAAQQANPGPMTLLTVIAEDPRGFGRIVRNAGRNR
jgi:bifunctional UDP-N-acetylglucosamine pyrophosphorylase / glucosamine-1-phosphate N-acetyltransferase